MQKWLDDNDITMYSIHKKVVAGQFTSCWEVYNS